MNLPAVPSWSVFAVVVRAIFGIKLMRECSFCKREVEASGVVWRQGHVQDSIKSQQLIAAVMELSELTLGNKYGHITWAMSRNAIWAWRLVTAHYFIEGLSLWIQVLLEGQLASRNSKLHACVDCLDQRALIVATVTTGWILVLVLSGN